MPLPFLLLHHQGQGHLAKLACAVESSDANSAPALKRGASSVSLTVVERDSPVKWRVVEQQGVSCCVAINARPLCSRNRGRTSTGKSLSHDTS